MNVNQLVKKDEFSQVNIFLFAVLAIFVFFSTFRVFIVKIYYFNLEALGISPSILLILAFFSSIFWPFIQKYVKNKQLLFFGGNGIVLALLYLLATIVGYLKINLYLQVAILAVATACGVIFFLVVLQLLNFFKINNVILFIIVALFDQVFYMMGPFSTPYDTLSAVFLFFVVFLLLIVLFNMFKGVELSNYQKSDEKTANDSLLAIVVGLALGFFFTLYILFFEPIWVFGLWTQTNVFLVVISSIIAIWCGFVIYYILEYNIVSLNIESRYLILITGVFLILSIIDILYLGNIFNILSYFIATFSFWVLSFFFFDLQRETTRQSQQSSFYLSVTLSFFVTVLLTFFLIFTVTYAATIGFFREKDEIIVFLTMLSYAALVVLFDVLVNRRMVKTV